MTATGAEQPSATEQAKSTAQEGAQQVRERAQDGARQARSRVRDEVDRRSTQAGEQMSGTADAIRGASSHLRDQGNEQGARAVEQAASRIESAGTWLRDSDGDRILRDVEDFGRRNPLAVVAGGVALGFAVSRLLKASSRRRYESGSTANGPAALGPGEAAGAAAEPRPGGVTVPDLPAPSQPGAPARAGSPGSLSGGVPTTSQPGAREGL